MNSTQSSGSTATSRHLSDEEIRAYDRDGFVVVENIFPADELSALNAEIDRLRDAAKGKQVGGMARNNILNLGMRSEIMRRMCEDERILELISAVVKPGIAIYSAKMVEKLPWDTAVCHWHQDEAYYRHNSRSDCRMSVWVPLQDCDEKNGCVWMMPGSHKLGLREASQIEDGKVGHCSLGFANGTEDIPGAIPVRVKAGAIVLFHALTWHRSLANNSDQHRRAFIVSYQDALATRGNGDQHKILRPAT